MTWQTVIFPGLENTRPVIHSAGDMATLLRRLADEIEKAGVKLEGKPGQLGPTLEWNGQTLCLCLVPGARVAAAEAGALLLSGLTERQREIVKELMTGVSAKAIARVLGIHSRTVEAHIHNIHRKTGTVGTIQLMEIVFSQLD
jgi:DNA-binding CsgD family transcriptional regulator